MPASHPRSSYPVIHAPFRYYEWAVYSSWGVILIPLLSPESMVRWTWTQKLKASPTVTTRQLCYTYKLISAWWKIWRGCEGLLVAQLLRDRRFCFDVDNKQLFTHHACTYCNKITLFICLLCVVCFVFFFPTSCTVLTSVKQQRATPEMHEY